MHMHDRIRRLTFFIAAISSAGAAVFPLGAQQPAAASCRVSGRVTNGTTALPGVALIAYAGETVAAATSTEIDGTYQLAVAPGAYRLKAELTGFTTIEQSVALGGEPCAQSANVQLALTPRPRGAPRPRRRRQADAVRRFETLNVQSQDAGAVAQTIAPEREAAEAATRLLLPPGFSTDAPTESLAVSGNMASIDRGMIGERLDAIMRGEFNPTTGEFGQGFGPGGRGGPAGGPGGPGGQGGPGGRGEGRGGPGGPGGRDFVIGGRGGRQNAYNIQANYTYGGSALDSAPYRLRDNSNDASLPYNRQGFGFTVGGPVRIPGVYNGQRRTTFTATYNGNRGDQLFEQYGTVPTLAMRNGDFSAISRPIVDPVTGAPFAGNQIPRSSMNPGCGRPPAIHPGAQSGRNAQLSPSDDHRQSRRQRERARDAQFHAGCRTRRSGRPEAAPADGSAAPGGRGGRGNQQQRTSVTLNAQLQYRRNDNEQNSLFPALGGQSTGSAITVPLSLNIAHRRTLHNVNLSFSRTSNAASGRYAFVEDVAGDAGFAGIATDPFAWGVPTLSFSSLSSVRDVVPSEREDRRYSLAYTVTRPWRNHTLRGGRRRSRRPGPQPHRVEPPRLVRVHRTALFRRARVGQRRWTGFR